MRCLCIYEPSLFTKCPINYDPPHHTASVSVLIRHVPGTMAARHASRLRHTSERAVRHGGALPRQDAARVADVTAQRERGRHGGEGPRSQGRRRSRRLRPGVTQRRVAVVASPLAFRQTRTLEYTQLVDQGIKTEETEKHW